MAPRGDELLEGMEFYLPIGLPNRGVLAKMIKENGGKMTRQAGAPNVITLQEPTAMKKRTRYLLSTKYIYDCVDFGEVLDHKPYMHEEIGTKRPPRKKYTIEDDARMLEFIKRPTNKDKNPMTLSTWELAKAENITAHSAESMREHYRKVLIRFTLQEQRECMAVSGVAVARRESSSSSSEEETKRKHKPESEGESDTEPEDIPGHQTREEESSVESIDEDDRPTPGEIELQDPIQLETTVNLLYHETGQAFDACIHALYCCSGDPNIAIQFLRGRTRPRGLWYPHEDENLKGFENATLDEIRGALGDGKFAHLRIEHTPADIYNRIQFLKG